MQAKLNNQKLTNIAQRALGKAWIALQDAFIIGSSEHIENSMWLFVATTGDEDLVRLYEKESGEIDSEQQILNCNQTLTVSLQKSSQTNGNRQIRKLFRKLYVKLIIIMKQRKYINFDDGYNPITKDDFDNMEGGEHGDTDSVETW